MKKLLSIILALVMALSAVSITALAADDYADFDGTITLGETRPVNLPGLTEYSDFAFIRFIPEKDGVYAISSDSRGNADCDPYLELYVDKIDTYVAKTDDIDSENVDFYLEYEFEAGRTYYFAMSNYRSATVWDITLECLHAVYEDGKCASCDAECTHEKVDNLFGSCPCGKEFDGEVITLTDGKFEDDVKCKDGEYTFYKFVPEKTGIYRAQSDSSIYNTKKPDPCCDVYDAQENMIAYHDDVNAEEGSENYDFDMVYKFEAGEIYFIGLWDYQAGKEWSFTFEDISTHSFEVVVPNEDDTTTPGEDDTTTAPDEGDTTTPGEDDTTTETTITVVHELTFVSQEDATCQEVGCTAYAYCKQCDNFEPIGKYEIPIMEHDFDEDGNCQNDGCDYVDPVLSCTHMCHSTGIMGVIWSIVRFFSWIFGTNPVCDCGVAHY